MTTVCYFAKETDVAICRSERHAETTRNAQLCSFYLFARKQVFVSCRTVRCRSIESSTCSARFENSPIGLPEYGSLRMSFFFLLFLRKIEFFSHSRISQRRPSFLQIAASRYRIGNFRNLSRPSDDLLLAHRPFDTANALDRSMHSTSLRSIDTSDTLYIAMCNKRRWIRSVRYRPQFQSCIARVISYTRIIEIPPSRTSY